jgi:hypothetical protein
MSDEPQFVNGLIFKMPHENAPDFVKGALSVRVEELQTFLAEQKTEWINIDLKISKAGKPYAQVNTFKPESRQDQAIRNSSNQGQQTAAPANQVDNGFTPNDIEDIPF